MPIPSPFHPRTLERCVSLRWKDWAGYYAVSSFDTYHEREYYAFRHTAGLIDVTPLYKYEVTGPDAPAFLARVMVKNVGRMKIGVVTYTCWCDDEGKVIDDGTVWRLGKHHFRVTAAEPTLAWLRRNTRGFDVQVEDSTERIAALSLQGPTSRAILRDAGVSDIDSLKYFRLRDVDFDGFRGTVTRTGYSGDLGFEVWVDNADALRLWDVLEDAGRAHGMLPAGLDAYDMVRVEAGYVMNGVDYYSANHCLIDSRKSTPYELDLGWTVKLDRDPFNGQAALRAEKERGPERRFVGLELDWDETERLFAAWGLPPEIPSAAWRESRPLYDKAGRQIGYASSGSWSPLLKKNLALATVNSPAGDLGDELMMELTVEHERKRVPAIVREKPFFDPERKRT
ncbi:MAG: aminomethyl transferase family protein [Gemmatimonadetes bacterium]|nr:aminomethyl transferase family protein [Gemmatimonadota bacterium]